MEKIKSKSKTCPICNEQRDPKYRPFCSKRCADIDLNRWLTGQYAVPVEEEEPDDTSYEIIKNDQSEQKLN